MAGSLKRRKVAGLIYLILVCLLAAGPLLIRLRRPAEIKIIGSVKDVEIALPPASKDPDDDKPEELAVLTPTDEDNGADPITKSIQTETDQADVMIYVHVAGQVSKPGLYGLPLGSRVHHAVEAAGGFSSDADKDSVNIALPVADGQQVYIPKKAVQAQAAPPKKPAVAQPKDVTVSTGEATKVDEPAGRLDVTMVVPDQLEEDTITPSGLMDINTASATQLETLPGIGPSTAAKIIEHRKNNGPFNSIEGLMDVSGIGPAKYAALKDLVMVR